MHRIYDGTWFVNLATLRDTAAQNYDTPSLETFLFRCACLPMSACIFGMFFVYFLIIFLHSLENVDFIKIAVFLQENNIFHGSEGSKILSFVLFFEVFSSKDFGIDFS